MYKVQHTRLIHLTSSSKLLVSHLSSKAEIYWPFPLILIIINCIHFNRLWFNGSPMQNAALSKKHCAPKWIQIRLLSIYLYIELKIFYKIQKILSLFLNDANSCFNRNSLRRSLAGRNVVSDIVFGINAVLNSSWEKLSGQKFCLLAYY